MLSYFVVIDYGYTEDLRNHMFVYTLLVAVKIYV